MESKSIQIGNKTFVVRELLATELDDALAIVDKKDSLRKQVTSSTGLTDEEYSKLSVKERIAIIKTMNELNTLDDFQKTPA